MMEIKNIDHNVFWAASKFQALAKETPPFFIMDTDFIVWNTLSDNLLKEKVMAIHDEHVNNEIYPSINDMNLSVKQILLMDKLNWEIKASNTAFSYFNDKSFKDKYLDLIIYFINNHSTDNLDRLIYMVLVEQRFFSMTADLLNIKIKYLIELDKINLQKNTEYTHIWGLKTILKNNKFHRMHFNNMCIKRINKEFPEFIERVENVMAQLGEN